MIDYRPDDLTTPAVRALVASHLAGMHDTSPPESVHALDATALTDPSIRFWTAWDGAELAGMGALALRGATRGEIKSMRVSPSHLGRGIGRGMLRHIVAESRTLGLASLWLETGSTAEFVPAVRLYESEGFVVCGPFDDYVEDPFSIFMTRTL
ncbi:GNAT family N-acetyltransferase [Microbacterium sp. NPDC089189]|uniref:GNAT family N-acetyltransferase n=1 Tax=Microbacterium sp. NPDC089189 TaxID=3154972 RepID=UPI0034234C85